MSANSSIEWTDATWNPVAGCTWASAGCDHCYAAATARRLEAMRRTDYAGLTSKKHFNGTIRLLEHRLLEPMSWRRRRRVFVNSMSDLFHDQVPFEFIDRVFAVMAVAHQHTYQVLTKRPERMAKYFTRGCLPIERAARPIFAQFGREPSPLRHDPIGKLMHGEGLEHVWLGTSCENQEAADERIPHLLRCPAAVRFLSCEPLLGEIDLGRASPCGYYCDESVGHIDHPFVTCQGQTSSGGIGWIIVGGESGPGARDCCVDEIESIISQCRAAGVPCFVKQLGARPILGDLSHPHGWPTSHMPVNWETGRIQLRHPKGGDPAEWPEDLRVREYPRAPGGD